MSQFLSSFVKKHFDFFGVFLAVILAVLAQHATFRSTGTLDSETAIGEVFIAILGLAVASALVYFLKGQSRIATILFWTSFLRLVINISIMLVTILIRPFTSEDWSEFSHKVFPIIMGIFTLSYIVIVHFEGQNATDNASPVEP